MKIRQTTYSKNEPPRDREILARFKPNSWPHLVKRNGEAWHLAGPHLVKWNGGAWQLVGSDIIKNDDDFIDWSEV